MCSATDMKYPDVKVEKLCQVYNYDLQMVKNV